MKKVYKIFGGWKLPLEQFLKQFCKRKQLKQFFFKKSLKSPVQEFLFHCTVFRNQFIFKNRGIIWKHFLHESSSSLKDLQLLCFEKNLILSQLVPVLVWNRDRQVARPGKLVSDFDEKLGRWSFIFESSYCPYYYSKHKSCRSFKELKL